MNDNEFQRLLDQLVTGDITADNHAVLQQKLKDDPNARAAFRERMDLEAGLRMWATESTASPVVAAETTAEDSPKKRQASFLRPYVFSAGMAAAILLAVGLPIWIHLTTTAPQQIAEAQATEPIIHAPTATRLVGFIREQEDCEWKVGPESTANQVPLGKLELSKGIAEVNFHSGTAVTLEGPCEIDITSIDEAVLLAGNACVNVSELSNGFTLLTPESQIIDEGTEYAVSLDDLSTEVHVFDGSVIWVPTTTKADTSSASFRERIDSGQARRYSRADPTKAKRIPFGKRQFARRLEDQLKQQNDGSLVAYDGFENLAGRVRRGRSGFGWADGWQSGGRGRGKVGEIVDSPNDVVFGFDRSQRRLMLLAPETDIRRSFNQPINLINDETIYISVLFERLPSSSDSDENSLQIALEPDLPGRGRRLHQIVSFGIAVNGFPFISSGSTITETATQVATGETVFCVLKLPATGNQTLPSLRVYRRGETIDNVQPSTWTVTGTPGSTTYPAASLRIIAGENSPWQIDELKLGTTWKSVTQPAR